MSVPCVVIFWFVNASTDEKSCLQFSIPTESGAGGEGGVSHALKKMPNTEISPGNFHIFFSDPDFRKIYWNVAIRIQDSKRVSK